MGFNETISIRRVVHFNTLQFLKSFAKMKYHIGKREI